VQKLLLSVAVLTCFIAQPATSAENVVLITIDGVRWQEAFTGISAELANHEEYSSAPELLMQRFWHDDPARRARLLMPFLHNTVMQQGTVIGDQQRGRARC